MKNISEMPIGTMEQDTIAAISTSMGESGIGIVRMSGPHSFSIAQNVFFPANGKKFQRMDNRKLRYGWIKDNDQVIDEVLVSFMKGPKTYTAEDVVEINAHGGAISVRKILALLLRKGARAANPGEFTRRAFLNGRMDLAQAEAVLDVIDAKTEKAHEQALLQLEGSVSKRMMPLKEKALQLLSHIEYGINFMEDAQEELPQEPMREKAQELAEEIDQLLQTAKRGRIIREGIKTVIVGKPNVGKSSLLNAMLEQNRAIVTDIPGTTRDAIEEAYQIDGIPLRLIDTAGIRNTEDVVEAMGVDRSRSLMRQADLVLMMVDGSRIITTEDEALWMQAKEKPCILLVNKSDLTENETLSPFLVKAAESIPNLQVVHISAQNRNGLEKLQDTILDMFFDRNIIADNSEIITNIRHSALLEKAKSSLLSAVAGFSSGVALDAIEVDCRLAYQSLCEITGESMDDDVLDRIFQDFCVGK